MKATGWWGIIVTAVAVTLGVYLALSGSWLADAWGAWACLVGIVVVYFAFGRGVVQNPRGPHDVILTVLNSSLLGLGVAFSPTLAILQTVVFPLLWYTARSVKAAYVLNLLVAVAVFIGFGFFYEWANPWVGLGVATASLAFSFAMGAWITSLVKHGEERSRLLDELQAVQGELAARNQDAGATSERERIARELHDTIAQNLTAIVMVTQRAAGQLSRSGEVASSDIDLDTDLDLVESLAQEALDETRALVATMSPVAIESGLADALGRLAERFERETGVSVRVAANVALAREHEVVLLRCAQEALANVRKHAKASRVDVTVEAVNGEVVLTVQDNGVGLSADVGNGFGLAGMRARVALAGGSVSLSSAGRGTLVSARLPEAS